MVVWHEGMLHYDRIPSLPADSVTVPSESQHWPQRHQKKEYLILVGLQALEWQALEG